FLSWEEAVAQLCGFPTAIEAQGTTSLCAIEAQGIISLCYLHHIIIYIFLYFLYYFYTATDAGTRNQNNVFATCLMIVHQGGVPAINVCCGPTSTYMYGNVHYYTTLLASMIASIFLFLSTSIVLKVEKQVQMATIVLNIHNFLG
ncbi:hypothetical protein ACJX0J_016050, partial [Zea mays]